MNHPRPRPGLPAVAPRALRQDAPSLVFLGVVAANTSAIAWASNPWLLCVLCAAQGLLLIGCQEAKHQCVHRTFLVSSRALNDAVGMVCGALFLENFHGYRQLPFAHHRDTVNEHDPEGHLYSRSPRGRWVWALAPIDVGWVAFHINWKSWWVAPSSARAWRNRGAAFAGAFALSAAAAAAVWPATFLLAYALPLALYAWIDFPMTQAEHYGVKVSGASERKRSQAEVTHDLLLPRWMSWMTLHRPLHRVHHMHPAMRWFLAPRHVGEGGDVPLTYLAFACRWLREGPNLWLGSDGARIPPGHPADARRPPRPAGHPPEWV